MPLTYTFLLLLLLSFSIPSFSHPTKKRSISAGPVIASNFADPTFIQVENTYYAFSTTSNKKNVPMANSTDFNNWSIIDQDAFPHLPAWTTGNIWAPDVIQLPNGTFVLYYSGTSKNDTSKHCIGAATSSTVNGPYTAFNDDYLACPLKDGGAIDPAAFIDPSSNNLYVTYKVDGNSLGGGGGPCGNADHSHPTPIMLQQLSICDGITRIGDPIPILDRGDGDGPLIEAPSLARSKDGIYILFFSSNCYNTDLYDVSYATAKGIKGPYTKSKKPLLKSGYGPGGSLKSPGGMDVAPDATKVVFHADRKKADARVREMYAGELTVQGTIVTI